MLSIIRFINSPTIPRDQLDQNQLKKLDTYLKKVRPIVYSFIIIPVLIIFLTIYLVSISSLEFDDSIFFISVAWILISLGIADILYGLSTLKLKFFSTLYNFILPDSSRVYYVEGESALTIGKILLYEGIFYLVVSIVLFIIGLIV